MIQSKDNRNIINYRISKVLPDEKMPIMIDKASGKQYRVEVVI